MALEDLTGTKYIDSLNSSNPAAGDNVSEGDDHIRGIKNVLKTTFPSIDGAVTATDTELNYVDGVTSNVQTQLNAITADDWVTSARIADDAVVKAAIADEAIDEARLHVSNAGTNGQFLAKQSGNAGGLTWTTVVSEDYIPDGSVMAFFQASAPTGWTQVTTQNDKTLRVVSGTGGGTGGDWAMSAGETTSSHGGHVHAGAAHSHNHNLSAGSHTLSTNEIPAHSHSVPYANHTGNSGSSYFSNAFYRPNYSYRNGGNHSTNNTGGGGGHSHSLAGSIVSGGAGDTSSAGSHTHTIAAPQYIDVIICSKDA